MTTVYVLKDPFTLTIRYVGATRYPLNTRLLSHLRDAKNHSPTFPKAQWIRRLSAVGKVPIIQPVCRTSEAQAIKLEDNLIGALSELLNVRTAGGGNGTRINTQKMKKRRIGKSAYWNFKPVIVDGRRLFKSVNEAAYKLKINRRGISNVLNGWSKTSAGHTFKYFEE